MKWLKELVEKWLGIEPVSKEPQCNSALGLFMKHCMCQHSMGQRQLKLDKGCVGWERAIIRNCCRCEHEEAEPWNF